MSQIIYDITASGGIITAINGGNNISVVTIAGVATVSVAGTTDHAVQVGNAMGALTSLALGNAGDVLTSNGPGLDPSFQTPVASVITLTGDTGGPVSPTAGNINILSNLLTNLAGATVFFDGSGSTLNFNTSDSVLANTFIGASSGNTTTTGANNTGVGVNSLFSLTTGSFNTAVGTSAGQQNAVGNNNTYVGFAAGSVTTSGDNTAIGSEAGRLTVGGSFNTSLGSGALRNNISGSQSVAIGYQTLFNATNTGNTAVGTQAGTSITTGAANTILGYQAGLNTTTGNTNIFIGNLAGQNITTSGNNICIGSGGVLADSGVIRIGASAVHTSAYMQGVYGNSPAVPQMMIVNASGQLGSQAIPTGTLTSVATQNATPQFTAGPASTINFAISNLVLGSSLPAIAGGTNNVGLGNGVLGSITSGVGNIAIGTAAGDSITSGNTNTLIGHRAGQAIVTSGSNTGIGYFALTNTTGSNNTALGSAALSSLTTGTNNLAIGAGTLGSITTGTYNVAVSVQGQANTLGDSSNAYFAHAGIPGDNNTIRIGTQGVGNGQQNRNFQAGIYGVTPAGTLNMAIIDNNGQLGSAALSPSSLFTWSVITADQTAAVNNGYFANKAGTLALALPAASAVGDVIEVTNENTALGVQFTQAAGQQILLPNNTSTTLGATGTLTSSAIGDSMKLVCKTANTVWRATSMCGNWSPA